MWAEQPLFPRPVGALFSINDPGTTFAQSSGQAFGPQILGEPAQVYVIVGGDEPILRLIIHK